MLAAYQVLDKVASVLVQDISISTHVGVECVYYVTFCFDASSQAGSSSEYFYEEIGVYTSWVF